MLALTLTLALLASSASPASARFMPLHRFTSLEGMAVDSDLDAAARPARHALDFAAFDRPLSAEPDPHHRVARDAAEACDCANDADLVGEIVESAPVMEDTLDAPVYQQPLKSAQFVESPEELHGSALSADDAEFDDDQEATLCEGGLEPLLEASDEPGAGRPARQTGLEADKDKDKVEAAEEQTPKEGADKVEAADGQPPKEGESQAELFPIPEVVPAAQGTRAVADTPVDATADATAEATADASEAQQQEPEEAEPVEVEASA